MVAFACKLIKTAVKLKLNMWAVLESLQCAFNIVCRCSKPEVFLSSIIFALQQGIQLHLACGITHA